MTTILIIITNQYHGIILYYKLNLKTSRILKFL